MFLVFNQNKEKDTVIEQRGVQESGNDWAKTKENEKELAETGHSMTGVAKDSDKQRIVACEGFLPVGKLAKMKSVGFGQFC